MSYQAVFRRYELKYMLTLEQKNLILEAISPYMTLDQYGRTTIRNIYFDTEDYKLIRASIDKPVYKEKLRVRSYEQATHNSKVFVEIKKKYNHVVYKRRTSMSENDAMKWLCERQFPKDNDKVQIVREIEYFMDFYKGLRPSVFLTYEREAYYSNDGSDFRVTFDDNILYRKDDLSLTAPVYGTSLLKDGLVLMEIKCSGGIPLWMVDVLSKEKIFKTSFSKYGTAYRTIIFPELKNTYNEIEEEVLV